VFYRITSWLLFIVFLYLGTFYSYTNLSGESFIFLVEGFYISVVLMVLYSVYHTSKVDNLYVEYLKLHYERVFIYSIFLKKLNVKATLLYRCFH